MYYMGNQKLRAEGVKVEYTLEQAFEIAKCTRDPIYFIKNYVYVNHVDHGIIKFDLWPFQERLVNSFVNERYTVARIGRQSGKSATTVAFLLWCVLFTHPDKPYKIAILAHKETQARELLDRLQMAYENLPYWMQQGVNTWNKGSIKLENGSTILAAATSSGSIRGGTFNLIYLDEFAHVPFNIQESFYSSTLPAISSGKTTKLIITSTPKGFNLFHRIWDRAVKKQNNFNAVDVHWSEVPGRDEAWREKMISDLGSELQFNQEFNCDFLGSSATLISAAKLATLIDENPIHQTENIKYFRESQPNRTYMITADVAEGVGLDYSAFVVFDVTELPFTVVATFKSNETVPIVFPKYILDVAKYYNNAYVLVETNNSGAQVVDILMNDLEYENIVSTTTQKNRLMATFGFGGKSMFGVKTTKSVKSLGCATLKSMIETDKLMVTDYAIIHELTNFIFTGSTYEADEGKNDDLAMCLVLFAWLTTQSYFKDITNNDAVKSIFEANARQIEEELTPFGIYYTGTEPERDFLSTREFNDWSRN